ncbi:MAG: hypothetical protein HRU38_26065 [Saccharospirillaceae bacterium]|nr:hypothetical protein [Saccharospirillaceae bacterium]
MTETEILEHIESGQLFGAVEVDLHVPPHLKEHFQEMPPIFKNITVTVDDIGDYMRDFLKQANRTFKDTKYLIGSMFASKILLITPLLKWYMAHGLVVTKIHQIIEFSPKKAFENFANEVSDDRRAGDKDPDYQAIADTSKLIGKFFIWKLQCLLEFSFQCGIF